MRILLARFLSGGALLEHYDASATFGALIVPTRARPPADEPLVVEVSFPELQGRVLLRGRADGAAPEGEPRLHVRLLPSEHTKRDYMLAAARGEAPGDWARRHRRFPLRVSVRFCESESGGRTEAVTEDLSTAGLFIRTPFLLPNRTPVTVELMPGTKTALAVHGHVAWQRTGAPSSGFGVSLDAEGRREARALRRLVRALKSFGAIDEAREDTGPQVSV